MFSQKSKLLLPTLLPLSIFVTLLTLHTHSTFPLKNQQKNIHIHNVKRILTDTSAATSACDGTLYPDLCVSTLATFPDLHKKSIPEIIAASVNYTVLEARASQTNCSRILRKFLNQLGPLEKRALNDCLELLDETISELKVVISDLGETPAKHYSKLQTFMSGAMTNQGTCLDGFAYSKKTTRKFIEKRIVKLKHHVSNSLAMLKKIPGVKKKKKKSPKDEVLPGYGRLSKGFPAWIKGKDRRLLQTSVKSMTYNLTVAQDGTGNFKTIGEALAAAPNSSTTRFVIYIKTGAYYEYLEVGKKQINLMFVGDGIGKTLIKGNRNVVDGWTTFRSSTVAVVGSGFIAKGITFENYAGASKHQAVALRVGADLAAFYQCSFVAYQDTLYVHSLRQFFSECDIYGTVDFIFGNSAVVFQKCNLYARKPDPNQKNIFTAQGREDPNQNTGISILNSKIAPGSDLIPVQSTFKSYLGRPWKEYSRTVYMYCNIMNVIDPAGYLEWDGTFALDTLYYGEHNNIGTGSNTSGRVTWVGYHPKMNVTEANQFTVGNFIQGGNWLSSTGIPYYLNLTS